MKKSMFVFLLLSMVVLSSCGGAKEKEIELTSGTVNQIYKEADVFAKQEFPESVLLGFTNDEPSIDRANYVPAVRDLTGKMNHWAFIYAKNVESFSDGEVNDEDAFSIKFENGKLILSEYAVVRDWTVDDSDIYGDKLLAYDSDYIFDEIVSGSKELFGDFRVHHLSFNAMMGHNEVSLFTSDTEGYSGAFNLETGEFSYIEGFEIVTY